jgi:hypothetical protein
MIRFLRLIIIILLCSQNISSAGEDDISFVLKVIQEDYPGYKDKIKGTEFNRYAVKVIREYPKDTFRVLSLLVNYFNDQHLVVYKPDAIKDIKHDSVICSENLKMLREYFERNTPTRYEGYWVNDRSDYVIAIKQISGNPRKLLAYAIETRNNIFPPGMICQQYEQIKGRQYLTNYTTTKCNAIFLESNFRNDSILTTGAYGKWRKLNKYNYPTLPSIATFTYNAEGRLLDKNNFLITIPGNSAQNTNLVNEIVRENRNLISSTQNLIIDIRNNMGGTIATYDSLIPFVYTKPIYQVDGNGYYSKVYIENLKERLNEYLKDSTKNDANIKELRIEIERRSRAKGKVLLNQGLVFKFDSIMALPKNVALITNYACQSAAEMMILDFKQSSKVKLFGEHTMGAVDYLSNFTIDLPSKKYKLMLPASKRVIPKGGSKIDGIGIYPDVAIPDSIENWVEFVQNYYRDHEK